MMFHGVGVICPCGCEFDDVKELIYHCKRCKVWQGYPDHMKRMCEGWLYLKEGTL
jgi:hypothetical protein